jgi:hypothetical protein
MAKPIDLADLDGLDQFATVRQLEYLEALRQHKGMRAAARHLGVDIATMSESISKLKMVAARQLPTEHNYAKNPVPEGFVIKGVSQYDPASRKWVKSSADAQAQAALMQAALKSMCKEIPKAELVVPPLKTYGNLCNVYTLTDSHVGMLAWHREGGEDWDLKIAEATLVGCFVQMLASAPAAGTCVIAQLGDYLHYDSALAAVTPTSGHNLDADGRMPKMVDVAIRILRTVTQLALEKHEKVILLLAEGNHDIGSSVWLRAMFRVLYEGNPRIEVIDSELPYYAYQHGETMIAWHHGHLKKIDQLPILFAAQFSKMWGNTRKRYIHTGHLHHVHIKEHSGVTVEQHPTLAARDAYAARYGWIAERQVHAITYSDKYGQVAKNTVTPEMLV